MKCRDCGGEDYSGSGICWYCWEDEEAAREYNEAMAMSKLLFESIKEKLQNKSFSFKGFVIDDLITRLDDFQ